MDYKVLPGLPEATRIDIGQTMAFIVLSLSELVHVFNVRNNTKSIFKTGIFDNKKLLLANGVSAALVFAVLLLPNLRNLFGIAALPPENVFEVICLVLAPVVIVEILKLFKINGSD